MLFIKSKSHALTREILNSVHPGDELRTLALKDPKLCLKVIRELEKTPGFEQDLLIQPKYTSLARTGRIADSLAFILPRLDQVKDNAEIAGELFSGFDLIEPSFLSGGDSRILADYAVSAIKNIKSFRTKDIAMKGLDFFIRHDNPEAFSMLMDMVEMGQISELDRSDPAYRFLKGKYFVNTGDNISAVETVCSLLKYTENAELSLKVHAILKELKNSLHKKYSRKDIVPEDILAFARIFSEQENYRKAADILKESLDAVPDKNKNPFLLQLGLIYSRMKNQELSIQYLSSILDQPFFDENSIKAAAGLIRELSDNGKVLEIEDPVSKKIERGMKEASRNPESGHALGTHARLILAELYYHQQRNNQSLKIFDDISRTDRSHFAPKHLLLFAKLLAGNGNYAEAVDFLSEIENKFKDTSLYTESVELMKSISRDYKKQEKSGELSSQELKVKEFLEDTLSRKKLINRLREGLSKTQDQFYGRLNAFLNRARGMMDEDMAEELEELLILSDIGVGVTSRIITNIEKDLSPREKKEPSLLISYIRQHLVNVLSRPGTGPIDASSPKPYVIMVVGVNGVGKTTTIAKLALQFQKEGKTIMIAACDTFRAAAIQQLEIWAQRLNVPMVSHKEGADPSAVAFDAVNSIKAKNHDVLIIDTAGRLHTKTNLMQELEKIKRTVSKQLPGAPHSTILVLDATNGQNAISQAKQFKQIVDINGIVLTKLDGTARGGIIAAISEELDLPIKYIGVGEKAYDLMPFEPESFVDTLLKGNSH